MKNNANNGHRSRLKQRIHSTKKGELSDLDLLEYLLCLAIPRKDVRLIAKTLIERHKSFAKIVNLDKESILATPGIGLSAYIVFKSIQESCAKLIKEDILKEPIIGSWKSVLEYCRTTMGHARIEQFKLLFLDRKNMLIADELQETGSIDQTPIYVREVVQKALHYQASSVVMVHNHPSGNTEPSEGDIKITLKVQEALKAVGITLHDHVIVSSSSYFSFKTNLLLK